MCVYCVQEHAASTSAALSKIPLTKSIPQDTTININGLFTKIRTYLVSLTLFTTLNRHEATCCLNLEIWDLPVCVCVHVLARVCEWVRERVRVHVCARAFTLIQQSTAKACEHTDYIATHLLNNPPTRATGYTGLWTLLSIFRRSVVQLNDHRSRCWDLYAICLRKKHRQQHADRYSSTIHRAALRLMRLCVAQLDNPLYTSAQQHVRCLRRCGSWWASHGAE